MAFSSLVLTSDMDFGVIGRVRVVAAGSYFC